MPLHPHDLTARLEAALVREIALEYMQLNRVYFKNGLTAPQFALVPARAHLGRWIATTRTLELSRPLVLEQPWGVVLEVLKHEMAHQYVHETLGETDQTPHGQAFRDACRRLGIDGAASGMPSASTTPWSTSDEKMIERIARLLALAESPNVHEAEAAMAAAQRLMLKHNIEVRRDAAARGYGFRHVGRPTGRVVEFERILAMVLGKYFFVEVIWVPVYRPLEGKRGSVLELCGTPSNVEIAAYVHQYLTHTAEHLWADHKVAHAIRGDRDRRTFLAGVMSGFAEKLARQAASNKEQGLVWVKDGDLSQFYRRRHPHIRQVRNTGAPKNEVFSHGREAGRNIVLHRGVGGASPSGRGLGEGSSGSRGGPPLLLEPRAGARGRP